MARITTARGWDAARSPRSLLQALKGRRLPRQRRRLAVECCRRHRDAMPDAESRQAVEAAERFLEHEIGRGQLHEAYLAAQAAAQRCLDRARDYPGRAWLGTPSVWQNACAWRLACAAQLVCAPSGAEQAVAQLLRADTEGRERSAYIAVIRDVVRNPFLPALTFDPAWRAWRGGTAFQLARAIHDERAFERLPVLADALEEAGCADAELLAHLRGPGPHVRGCWALEMVLGRR